MLDTYFAFSRVSFLKMLAYRLRFYTGIFTYFLFVSVYYFIWKAVYAGQPDGYSLNGFTLSEMITYVAIGWIARSFYHSNIDYEVDELVRSGHIANFLLRPVSFQGMMFFQAAGESLFRLILFSLPISFVICTVFPVIAPQNFTYMLYFICSTVLGFLILAALNFLVGLWAFSLKSIRGVVRAKQNLIQLCSGLLIPISFFPEWVQKFMAILPFQSIAYTPLKFYLGKISLSSAPQELLIQLAWAVGLILLGQILWYRAATQLSIQGG